jgi:hypothetical protein
LAGTISTISRDGQCWYTTKSLRLDVRGKTNF